MVAPANLRCKSLYWGELLELKYDKIQTSSAAVAGSPVKMGESRHSTVCMQTGTTL